MGEAQVYLDDDADLSFVQDRNVALLGYGDQARGHALCLRDSGVDVRLGLEAGSAPYQEAMDDGLRVVPPYEATEEADLFVLADPVEVGTVVADVVLPNLVPGDAVILGPEVAPIPDLPAEVDVARVGPWAEGRRLRSEYEAGRGVPMFVAVVTDASGSAWQLALAYARAVGGTRAGVLRVAEDDLTRAKAAADRMLEAELLPVFRRTFDDLTESGCPAVVAYVHCLRSAERFARMTAGGASLTAAAALVEGLAHRRAGGGSV